MLPSPKAENNNKEEEAEEEETIEKKIASAASAPHDVPIPRPRTSLLKEKQSPMVVAEKTSCWEVNGRELGKIGTNWPNQQVLEYPEELNPFGSDEEEEEEMEEEKEGKKEREEEGGPNPFESDSEEEEAENDGRNKPTDGGNEGESSVAKIW